MRKKLFKVWELFYSRISPISYAKKIGVQIGDNCKLNGSPEWGSEPYLVKIGNHTEISYGCAFITHDGSTWVFREKEQYKGVLRFGGIKIGNNCFIGARTTILPNVTIGNNVIIGACSLVTKSVPSGEVWGGVPAHFITKTEVFAERCRNETPEYDLENFKLNKKDEVQRMLKWN